MKENLRYQPYVQDKYWERESAVACLLLELLVLVIRLATLGFFQLGMGEILLNSSKYLLY